MQTNHKPNGPYEAYFKRPLDFLLSFIAIIFFSWLYIIVALLVRIKLGSPVLFTQDRPGKDEKIFKLYKFRSMSNECDENGKLLPDSKRLTTFGKWLRSSSLDEIPELFNIIKGDMSLIGPRPLVVAYLPYYTSEERHRHDVRPGLSGLAQINGRNGLQWEERFKYDLKYVNNITFINDINIISMTVKKALVKEGIVVRGTGKTIDFNEYRKNQNKNADI